MSDTKHPNTVAGAHFRDDESPDQHTEARVQQHPQEHPQTPAHAQTPPLASAQTRQNRIPLTSSVAKPTPAHTISSRTHHTTLRAQRREVTHPRHTTTARRVAGAIAGLVVVALLVFVVATVVIPRLTGQDSNMQEIAQGTEVHVVVNSGDGAAQVANTLYDAKVIASKSEFLATLRKLEAEQSIKPGSYKLTAGASMSDIVNLLIAGPNDTSSSLVIPEGFTTLQIAQRVEETLSISAEDFLNQAKASNYVEDFSFLEGVNKDSLEGYLFPKTYDFSGQEVTADLIIRAMLTQFAQEVASLNLPAKAQEIGEKYNITLSVGDLVNMASIIERESNTAEDRPRVASVFYNRLREGMRLESDATLAYELNREVTGEDLQHDAEYNTRTRDGFPPTPICCPGLESLEAAVNPEDTNYFFFYISGDYHVFSETYDQHLEAIRKAP